MSRMLDKYTVLITVLAVIIVILLSVLILTSTGNAETPPTISGKPYVIDGDTLEVSGYRVRLFGINAPEKHTPAGQAATAFLRDVLSGETITCRHRHEDRYGRYVAVCLMGRTDIAKWLVMHGWAQNADRWTSHYQGDEDFAALACRGMWSGQMCGPLNGQF